MSEGITLIWPALQEVLKVHTVYNYSIFLDTETHTLVRYVELESEEKWRSIAETEICKKWWVHISGLMETNIDDSPVSMDLESVFCLP